MSITGTLVELVTPILPLVVMPSVNDEEDVGCAMDDDDDELEGFAVDVEAIDMEAVDVAVKEPLAVDDIEDLVGVIVDKLLVEATFITTYTPIVKNTLSNH